MRFNIFKPFFKLLVDSPPRSLRVDALKAGIIDQAKEFNQSSEKECLRILIHGLLHLTGYDDQSDEEKEEMTKLENLYLSMFLKSMILCIAIYHFFFLKPTSNPNFFTDLNTFIIPAANPSIKKINKKIGLD